MKVKRGPCLDSAWLISCRREGVKRNVFKNMVGRGQSPNFFVKFANHFFYWNIQECYETYGKRGWRSHLTTFWCYDYKHCQRHNGPEGWVLRTKVTSLSCITRSKIFRISTKHQLQNLNQTSAFRQNLNLKILTKPSLRISTKIKLHNHNQASAAK